MFIDLSGFTPLTQSLMRQGNEGAERLSIILNNIFGPMVELVYNKGGFIPYFAGDAFTAIFPEEDTTITPLHLLQTAQQMRDLFSDEQVNADAFDDFKIGIKIGLSHGEVEWGIVGDEHKSYFFRGPGIDNCAKSEHQAQGQDIIFDQYLGEHMELSDLKLEEIEGAYYRLLQSVKVAPRVIRTAAPLQLSEVVLEKFLPEAVIAYDQGGEFRNVITVFISFDGVDNYDLLNQFASAILEEMHNFSGYFKEIDFGDKGGVMLGFFGAPVTFENNDSRALEFAYNVREIAENLQATTPLRFRMGITSGLAYTGIVGGEERCQYAAVGNRVNLAARLMMYADWNTILVDENIQRNRYFRFNHIGDTQYKGIQGDIPTYELMGRNLEDKLMFTGNMIGRQQEMRQLMEFASPIFEGQFAGIIYLYGEAGIGKTRLAYEFKRELRRTGHIGWVTCQADQILKKPFNPFIYFLKNYFEQSPEFSLAQNTARFEQRFATLLEETRNASDPINADFIAKELERTRSILASQIGIFYPDSLWEQLDAKGRYQNIFAALENLFKALALEKPLIIELEDGHWYDEDSKDLLRSMLRPLTRFPIIFLVTSRYLDDGSKPKLLSKEVIKQFQIAEDIVDLNILDQAALRKFAELWLRAEIDQELLDQLYRSTNGNPFYAEQILEYFTESNLLKMIDNVWHIKDSSIKITNSINSILMARIDRLSSLVKETVKAAAVIGREFEIPVLSEVMKQNSTFVERNGNVTAVLREQIQTAEKGQIWRATNELRYIFKHSLLRETVYEMQLRTRLRELHRLIAHAIEKLYPETIEERFVDLAFHYGQAEVEDKTNEYLEKAADYARRNFQNQQALDFYNRLLAHLDVEPVSRARVRTLLKKGSVLQLIGRWDDCEQVYQESLQLANQLREPRLLGKTNNNLGYLLLLKGNYEKANSYLELAVDFFEKADDQYGIVNVFGNLGNLYFRQGRYQEAKSFFTRSIQLSQTLDKSNSLAQITANLGLTFMNQGRYDEGIQCQLEGLRNCEDLNDKQGMASLHTNLGIVYYEKGDYDAALEHYEQGLQLSEELGNKLLTSIAIGCIGSVYQKKGDFEKAMENFILDLELCEQLGDKQGIAIAIGLIGELRSIEGEFDIAVQYLERNLELCEELNYQKGIAKAVNTLADIFTFRGEYDKAIEYYDRAIEISRAINNRLVLCSSLVEKAGVLMAKQEYEAAAAINRETMELADDLGNPDLIFEAMILAVSVSHHSGNAERAVELLQQLLEKARGPQEEAAIYYEWWDIEPANDDLRQKALDLYRSLYNDIPKYVFAQRIKALEA